MAAKHQLKAIKEKVPNDDKNMSDDGDDKVKKGGKKCKYCGK